MGQAGEVGRGERRKLLPPSPHASRLRLGSTNDCQARHVSVSLTPITSPSPLPDTEKDDHPRDGDTSPRGWTTWQETHSQRGKSGVQRLGGTLTSAKCLQTSGKGSQLQPLVQMLAVRDTHRKRQECRDRDEISRKVNLSSSFIHRSFYMFDFFFKLANKHLLFPFSLARRQPRECPGVLPTPLVPVLRLLVESDLVFRQLRVSVPPPPSGGQR